MPATNPDISSGDTRSNAYTQEPLLAGDAQERVLTHVTIVYFLYQL